MIISGIDEAGRGPVIGPIVIAIALIDEKNEEKLRDIGVKDSKLLSPAQRERIFHEIKKLCKHEILIIPPKEIDSAVDSDTTNLNWLEADAQALLINKNKCDKSFIDCPSTNPKAYTEYLKRKIKYDLKLVVEHKADLNYLICGAASILAKVTRDEEIEKIKKKYNIDIGSGYPSDPVTAQFVRDNWDKYDFFRKSWSTWKTAAGVGSKKQKSLGDF